MNYEQKKRKDKTPHARSIYEESGGGGGPPRCPFHALKMRHPPQQLALTGGDHTGGSDISISHIRLAGLSVDRNLRRSDVETDAPVPMAAECPMISHTVENVRALTLSGFSRAVDIMKERTITQGERARFQAGDVCQIQWSSQAAAGSHLSGLRLLNGWCTVELDTLDIGSLRKLHMAGRRSGCTCAPAGSCIMHRA